MSNLIELGFDVVISAPAPGTWRAPRCATDSAQFTNWFRSTELALFTSVPQVAIRYGIDLDPLGREPGAAARRHEGAGPHRLRRQQPALHEHADRWHDWMLDARGYTEAELIAYPTPRSTSSTPRTCRSSTWAGSSATGRWSTTRMYSCAGGPADAQRRRRRAHRRPVRRDLARRGLGHADQPDDQVLQVRFRPRDRLRQRGDPAWPHDARPGHRPGEPIR